MFLDEDDLTPCYRNSGIIPVPRKIFRRVSVPAFSTSEKPPPRPSRKLSCPTLKIREACEEELSDLSELTKDFVKQYQFVKDTIAIPKYSIQPKSEADTKAKSVRPKIISEKIKTREPDIVKEMKRGSMKEKWGLSLVYRVDDKGRLEIAVKKVGMFSAAAKVGIQAGNIVIQINDWKIEAMDQYQAALNIFMAAGFSVNLGWLKSEENLEGWGVIDAI